MKKPACVFSMMRDEALMAPHWLRYYKSIFDRTDIYVDDDQSIDETRAILNAAGVNTQAVNRKSVAPGDFYSILRYVQCRMTELLEQYQCVLYAEADEFIIPANGSLLGYMNEFVASGKPWQQTTNLEVVHDIETEPDLVLDQPWMMQRSRAINIPKFDNPQLWSVVPTWVLSFHYTEPNRQKGKGDGSLYQVHCHHIDFDTCLKRHRVRKAWNVGDTMGTRDDVILRDFFIKKKDLDASLYENCTSIEIPEVVKVAF